MSAQRWLLGFNAVSGALTHDPERVSEVLLASGRDDRRARELVSLSKDHGIPLTRLSRAELDRRLPGHKHQGAAARYEAAELMDETALFAHLERCVDPLLLVLDHLQDPRNFGACLRTAEAAGVAAVVFPRDRAVDLTPVARKAAVGSAERLALARVTNLARTLERLQQAGLWLVGADGGARDSLYDLSLAGPLAVVIGGEGAGLKRLVRERCDHLARIPMAGSVESLNVSVAAGILLFEARRQRAQASANASIVSTGGDDG